MKHDIIRVAAVLIISFLFGLLFGRVFLCISIGLLLYSFWYLNVLNNLLSWMKFGSATHEPDIPGLVEQIARQYDELLTRHKKRKQQLTNYLKRFRETTQALPDAIVVLGEYNRIEWANKKAGDYLGISNSRDQGQRIINLIRHPDLVKFIRESSKLTDGSEKSLELISPVNKEIHLEIRLVFFGKTDKLLMARDITKIYRINRMRTDFIANASHELRTPLTVISGYLESFEDELSPSKSEYEIQRIKQMRKQTERMRNLIEDLLKLSALETAEELIDIEYLQVADIIHYIVDEVKSITDAGSYNISVEADENLLLTGNRNQIHSAISNLVYNALQYTSDGGRIIVRWFCKAGNGVLEVEDSGEGISSEHIPRITERFYRVDRDRSREKGGTGLGLAIVKHILVNHKAKLEVESKPGTGSIFRFIFPKSKIHGCHVDTNSFRQETALK